jgi:hypothetical protein
MLVVDFEVYKYDWLICFLDTETRKIHFIVNDKEKLERFYEYYKSRIMVGYNIRGYDQYILKAILCDFDPFLVSDFIINQERKGWEFSNLFNKFPIVCYDCSVGFKSLKEIEAHMGHNIKETSVPFDIDRPLTKSELLEVIEYCKHDVWETFEVFVETKQEFESHMGLLKEFKLPLSYLNKTKAQLSAIILGAVKKNRFDEFDISFPDTLELGKHSWLLDKYTEWAESDQNYESLSFTTMINDVEHTFGIGGLHGAKNKYFGTGHFLMADVGSYYPAIMIEYNFLSRNVLHPEKYKQIRDERIRLKMEKDAREYPRKIVLNSTFGASKDLYNALYDPQMSNNVCIAGQLLLVDLLDKLDGKCELIQTNTDGILVKLYRPEDKAEIIGICESWASRTRMTMDYEDYTKVIQRDVNNYIIVPTGELYDSKGKPRWKSKGAVVKKLSRIDNDLPIINKAVVNYFIHNIPVEKTINESQSLVDFQKVTKISRKYDYGVHTKLKSDGGSNFTPSCRSCKYIDWGYCHKLDIFTDEPCKHFTSYDSKLINDGEQKILSERVIRCFASNRPEDGTLYKKHKDKDTLDKTPSTPEKCFIDNSNIENTTIPEYLDKQWYIDLAKQRIEDFI